MNAFAKYSFLMILLTLVSLTYAQTTEDIEFTYDLSGNRVLRHIIILEDKIFKATDTLELKTYKESIDEIEISIFPNPNHGTFSIYLNKVTSNINMFIHTITGELILDEKIKERTTYIDISNQMKGSYILSVFINGKKKSWKIIKQ
jgi:hypothetical protein